MHNHHQIRCALHVRALNEAALLATIWNLRRATKIHGDIFVSNAFIRRVKSVLVSIKVNDRNGSRNGQRVMDGFVTREPYYRTSIHHIRLLLSFFVARNERW